MYATGRSGNPHMDLSAVAWRKSSYSSGGGNECVEIATPGALIAVRDSKDPRGPALLLDRRAFGALTGRIKRGDRPG